jgi:hypothetical protein
MNQYGDTRSLAPARGGNRGFITNDFDEDGLCPIGDLAERQS